MSVHAVLPWSDQKDGKGLMTRRICGYVVYDFSEICCGVMRTLFTFSEKYDKIRNIF